MMFGGDMNILITIKVKILIFNKWSYRPPIMLTTEPGMMSVFWTHSPISLEHMSLSHLFLDPHLTTYHSNTGVHMLAILEIGTSTLGTIMQQCQPTPYDG